jgi:hypothetical protein
MVSRKKRKSYKGYNLGVNAYGRKGYVKLIHKRTGNIRYRKVK